MFTMRGENMQTGTLGQKVKEVRLAKKMTQKELAGDYITRNMLSQIENDSATPSIKTMEYIASVLEKPMSYFMDNDVRYIEGGLVEEMLKRYEEQDYLACIEQIEEHFTKFPQGHNNNLLRNIYTNCCMKAASALKEEGKYEDSKILYEKILKYENDLLFESDVILYNVYSQLAEVNGYLETVEISKEFDEKATNMVNKMLASRVIQGIYISFIEGQYDEVIKRISTLEISELDEYNKGRYYMMIGSAYYYKEDYHRAIKYLEVAIDYYINKPYNSVLEMIYDELSRSYSQLEEYKEAYEYLKLSQKK